MEYRDIIQDNCKNHSPVSWWPRFAFHYTDVTNAVSILSSGYLYSRAEATKNDVMKNDNASSQVIGITRSEVISKVRLYYRPLIPTQYYTEGYKHQSLRYKDDLNANVPVPIFLLFYLEKVLRLPGVQFSQETQAKKESVFLSGIEEFSKLDFDKIYDNDYSTIQETKPYRQAEINHTNAMDISSCISCILCRNNLDRMTILNLLRDENYVAFARYKDIIKTFNNNIFFNNGIFISDCSYYENTISILFADSYYTKKYIERKAEVDELEPINARVSLTWNKGRSVIYEEYIDFKVYLPEYLGKVFSIKNLPSFPQAQNIGIKVYLDGKLICYSVQPSKSSEVLL